MVIPFIETYLPDVWDLFFVIPISFLFVTSIGFLAYSLKTRYKLKTNYSRKIFHFIIFTSVLLIGIFFPLHRVAAFSVGAGIFILLLITVPKKGFLKNIYFSLAREQDEPHRSYFLLIPFIATALGGLTTGVLFSQYYQVGYLTAGWGDASGEPIGVRFGKHKYNVPTLSKTKCTRSLEGSLSVFFFSYLAAALVLIFLEYGYESFFLAIAAGFVTMLIEAISPHGWDNFTTQLSGCIGIYLLLSL